ncbi:MAG: hypothetical protein ACREHE_16205 [Rhizomicrobium sp.]
MTHISASAPAIGSRINSAIITLFSGAVVLVLGAVSLGAFLA